MPARNVTERIDALIREVGALRDSALALERDLIGICACNAGPNVAPYGGAQPLHGTNPLAYAFPGGEEPPIVLDIATSVAASGQIAKARRPNKVFADYLRNSETASAVAAFSPRARPNAGVSVPLAWDELDPKEDVRPRFNVLNVPERLASLKRDPWADYWNTRQSITAKMRKSLGL